MRFFQIQRQNVRESGLWSLQELKLCVLFFGSYPTIAKSLKRLFEPQKRYFRNCRTTHSQIWSNQTESFSLNFCSLCGSTLGFPNAVCSSSGHHSRETPDGSLFLPDCNQGEGTADVCFWVYRLGALKLNSVALVRERTIPTERPPPVGEVSANFCGWRGVTWSAQLIPTAVNLCFLDQSRYLFIQVAPQLTSRG